MIELMNILMLYMTCLTDTALKKEGHTKYRCVGINSTFPYLCLLGHWNHLDNAAGNDAIVLHCVGITEVLPLVAETTIKLHFKHIFQCVGLQNIYFSETQKKFFNSNL